MKQPAFLFYTKDYFEGTRTMTPKERACYVDLLCYQHQNGFIPDNLDKLLLYCSGINKGTLKATLEGKFRLTPEGWINDKLHDVKIRGLKAQEQESRGGILGVFYRKAKSQLSPKEYENLKDYIEQEYGRDNLIEDIINNDRNYDKTLKGTLEGCLNYIANVNVNVDKVKGDSKGKRPTKQEWLSHIEKVCSDNNISYPSLKTSAALKYDSFVANGWKDGFNKPIKNWKSKANNQIPHLKREEKQSKFQRRVED